MYVRRGDRIGWSVSPIDLPSVWPASLSWSTHATTEQARANLQARLERNFDSVYTAATSPQIGHVGGSINVQVTARGDFGDSSHVAGVITMEARGVGFIFSDSNVEFNHFQSQYPAGQGQTNGGDDETVLDSIWKDLKRDIPKIGDDLFDKTGLYIVAGLIVFAAIMLRR